MLIAREFLGDDDFVMYLGDNLLEQDLAAFVDAFERARDDGRPSGGPDPAQTGARPPPLRDRRPGRRPRRALVEKPVDPPTDLALVGVYLFDPTIHDAVRAIEPSARGELEITDAIQWLIDQGHRVRTELLTGWWIDTGKLTPLLEANRLLLERIERRIDGDRRRRHHARWAGGRRGGSGDRQLHSGPVAIGRGTRIVDSSSGRSRQSGRAAEIEHSEIEHSVVMDNSEVIDIPRLEDSLIGREAIVARSQRRPRALRLMVGDHCQIDVE